ncbi:SMP-30/gluconolactonase/LRE family protein [Steroidobacter sp.]|uniref:SMP-30/gluconolactonase/LRE family protein n=1 Tax=Steroidobacter sp. TaxID=1978227 RepID=UPI001A52C55D|nr:SMP-30/gluconolactonase/LRE family protein [Steroidobacter sp.]MBL8272024.1 SMP-30/gluconolactonase/LRE family protein [Steroidobacter sp.]
MKAIARKIVVVIVVLLIAAVAYLSFWPVPVEPVPWQASTPPGYTGAHAPNSRLSGLRTIAIGSETGPEHIAIGKDGKVYAAMTSGNLLRMEPDGAQQEIFANTGGRVLGFDFDAQGRLIAADAMKGLVAIAPDKSTTVLTDHVSANDPIRYANSVVVAPDGTIYFTDSSTRFAPADWVGTYAASVLDVMEQSGTGRILAYEPATNTTRIVARGLSFANGIALSVDGHTLFVNETARYRVWKIDGRAHDVEVQSGSPQAKILLDNLPGYPDNLMRGRDGRIWVGLVKPRNPAADSLADKPFLRKVLLRLPRSFLPLGKPYGHVFAFDEDGRVTEDLQDPSGAYPETTGVTETEDRLYIHSLDAHEIGWLPPITSDSTAADSEPTPEEIYVLRSIREQHEPVAGWCASAKTGFEPFPQDAERFFSFWSLRLRPEDGRVVETKDTRVAELRACFGATKERARQNFYAEVSLGSLSFQGNGECLAVRTDFPEAGLFPVRCQLVLSGLPPPYVGGLLTTNTLTSQVALGGDTDPPGYTQASIATIRLWQQQ